MRIQLLDRNRPNRKTPKDLNDSLEEFLEPIGKRTTSRNPNDSSLDQRWSTGSS
jgi:hypothetical protein